MFLDRSGGTTVRQHRYVVIAHLRIVRRAQDAAICREPRQYQRGYIKVPLEGVDVRVSSEPDLLEVLRTVWAEELRMYPDHQNVLVVGPVEDADHPAFGQALGVSPEEVV